MSKLNKIFFILLLVCVGTIAFSFSLADTSEDITAKDLEVSDPVLLPGSPFYFLKEWGRGIQSFFAFGQLKKAELEQKFASERLLELRKLAEQNKISPTILDKATSKYEKSIEKIKNHADKIKEKAAENAGVNKFLGKFSNQQVLHGKILQKLQDQVPPEALEKIKEAREQHLEKFQEVMQKLNQKACTMEAKQCPDGSYVGRTGPNCEFAPCPLDLDRSTTPECKESWWFDNNNKTCQQKQFCGAYTYPGLKTFKTEKACQEYLDVLTGKSCSIDADCGTSDPPNYYYRCVNNKCEMGIPI